MIPSHWFRRALIFLFLMEVVGGITWATAQLSPHLPYRHTINILGTLMFIVGMYAGAPLFARFLAPKASDCLARRVRMARIAASKQWSPPVFVYDHPDKTAVTVGLLPRWSKIYITTSLLDSMTDDEIAAIIGHEYSHIRELHILWTLLYACLFSIAVHTIPWKPMFLTGFLFFLTFRRWFEYRADAGSARLVGPEHALTMLTALERMLPTKKFERYVSWLTAYPTLPMRIKAIQTGRRPLF